MLSNMIRTSAKEARQQDTHDLKHCLQFVPSDPNVAISPPLGNGSSKSDRGINHPMLRNYIVSWTIRNRLNLAADESVDEDDSFGKTAEECLSLLLNGKIEVDQSAWPSCFYADGAYDPEDEEKGLFRSPFLARVGRTIWTAASSAMSRPKSTLPARCNARSHGVSKVNPAMIAYICVQARTMLSTTDWTADDEQFDYCIFFDSIVQLFEDDPTDPWAVETLAWFQNEIFGSASETQSSSGRKKGSAAEKILAKRKTRVAATAAP
ncbi:hypothetical protein K438DRAFT_1800005 [Mycena galopus ATCC 62051]|nr:hypothetical protein K438DRAFT_1806309 [Mycena galopus ATCC 62051]KAF8216059.1 hypothetical protein K438DRAFT_1800005 [Mycena galopus ATCC 62051]